MPSKSTVLITGANRGIGQAFAKAYHAKGWRVIATARKPSEAADNLNFLPKEDLYKLDVTAEDSIHDLGRQLKGVNIDLLINNAGIAKTDGQAASEIQGESVMLQFRVNSLGPLLVTHALLSNLSQGPDHMTKVINITSRMGSIEDNTSGGRYGYRASKAALNAITKTMAINFVNDHHNIATMALHPGFIQTDMTSGKGDMGPDEAVEKMMLAIEGLSIKNSGCFMHRDGYVLPY